MAHRIDVPRPDLLPDFEARLRVRFRPHVAAAPPRRWNCSRSGESWRSLRGAWGRFAGFNFFPRYQSVLDQQLNGSRQPFLVIAHSEIIGRREKLDAMAGSIDVPLAPRAERAVHGVHAAFPRLVKDRL